MIRRVILGVALAASPSVIAGQQPEDPHKVQPERPTVATHAGTVAPGWMEVETGLQFDRQRDGSNSLSTPTVLKIGVASRTQLALVGSLVRAPGMSMGIGDVAVDAKWRLLEDAPVLGDFALLPAIKFPTGSVARGTGSGTTDISLLAISSHDVGPVAVDINVGYTHRGGDGSTAPREATLWTVSLGGPLAGQTGWVFEIFGYPGTSGPSGAAPTVSALAGPTMIVKPWLAVDAGVIEPISGSPPRSLYAGAVYNFGKVWE